MNIKTIIGLILIYILYLKWGEMKTGKPAYVPNGTKSIERDTTTKK